MSCLPFGEVAFMFEEAEVPWASLEEVADGETIYFAVDALFYVDEPFASIFFSFDTIIIFIH